LYVRIVKSVNNAVEMTDSINF